MFGRWDFDHEGTIDCWCALDKERQRDCERCQHQGFITVHGTAEDAIGDHAYDYFGAVMLIVRALQGETPYPRTPGELYDEPAKWIAAFEFLAPFAAKEIEEHRKRCQQQT